MIYVDIHIIFKCIQIIFRPCIIFILKNTKSFGKTYQRWRIMFLFFIFFFQLLLFLTVTHVCIHFLKVVFKLWKRNFILKYVLPISRDSFVCTDEQSDVNYNKKRGKSMSSSLTINWVWQFRSSKVTFGSCPIQKEPPQQVVQYILFDRFLLRMSFLM